MEVKHLKKNSFTVIGKLGSTDDGANFIQKLWGEFNLNFQKISKNAKRSMDGKVLGIWGIMSSFDQSFGIWEDNYSKGLYLAGVEVDDNAVAPMGFTRWKIPEFEYVCVKVENNYADVFRYIIGEYLPENNFTLAGAVQEFYAPDESMQLYLYFPIH